MCHSFEYIDPAASMSAPGAAVSSPRRPKVLPGWCPRQGCYLGVSTIASRHWRRGDTYLKPTGRAHRAARSRHASQIARLDAENANSLGLPTCPHSWPRRVLDPGPRGCARSALHAVVRGHAGRAVEKEGTPGPALRIAVSAHPSVRACVLRRYTVRARLVPPPGGELRECGDFALIVASPKGPSSAQYGEIFRNGFEQP